LEEFHSLWHEDFVPTTAHPSFQKEPFYGSLAVPDWKEVEASLWDTTSSIEVKTINGSAADALNYTDHGENGLNVIAIGGDKLSRGLTLEGLTVSYFLRASKMYDTLMQMGRWFGYRSNYADLCRLYTTSDLLEWFAHIAVASEELRKEFEYMFNTGGTPRSYGLKVRSHPTILITSAVKMRSGETMRLSYSGDISETIIFHRTPEVLQANLTNTGAWLTELGPPTPESNLFMGYQWTHVSGDQLISFLQSYQSHQDSHRARTDLISKYIRKQNEKGELTDWTVHLVSNSKDTACGYSFNGIGQIGMIQRSQFPANTEDARKYTIRSLVSPSDEARDLNEAEKDEALRITIENWENNKSKKKPEAKPVRPGGREIRKVRPKQRGLLLLYPLDPAKANLDLDFPVIGIAISFPESDTAEEISYTVTKTYQNLVDYEDD
jgi:hypothetical protein